ncbi:helix-turn-helix domain-containing protein [Thomasclavelia cocleata]|uniref:helix-turn-helix domain-containing protein n=2 Tax=Thomasclavelia cocleata TaxID=69824 RepID=UPI00241ED3C6|nr:helix-turn-helix domain-containing protein [Thomasclavelia cocleata]
MNKDYMYFYKKVSSANISPTAKTVYRALLYYANRETWSCFPSIATLSKDTGLSKRTIIRQIAVLEKEDLLLRIHRTREKNNGKTSNIYFLN